MVPRGGEEEHDAEAETSTPKAATAEDAETEDGAKSKAKRKREAPPALVHEPGKSVFPVSRVQRILKADKVRFCSVLSHAHYISLVSCTPDLSHNDC